MTAISYNETPQFTDPLAPHAKMVLVTPALAEFWLNNNDGNRNIRPAVVKASSASSSSMSVLARTPIGFSPISLMDAQHRLTAVKETGIPQWMLFVYNVPEEAAGTIDQGANRSVADILAIRGVDVININVIAGAARLLTETTSEVTGSLQRDQLADYIEEHLAEMENLVTRPNRIVGLTDRNRRPVLELVAIGEDLETVQALMGFFDAADRARNELCPCHGERCRLTADDPRHGTKNGYMNLYCRCKPCTKANTVSSYADRKRRYERPTPDHVHGTENGYGNYGCRCRACTDVWSAAVKARKHRADARKAK